MARWRPLHVYTALDYLRSVSILDSETRATAVDVGGRNRVIAISIGGEGSMRWVLKQFGSSDSDGQLFQRELRRVDGRNGLAVRPAVVDRDWRILIYPFQGRPLSELLRQKDELPRQLGAQVRESLLAIQGQEVDQTRSFPPILTWLIDVAAAPPSSFAQKRVLAALLDNSDVKHVVEAAQPLFEKTQNLIAVHGDVKLDHIIVGDAGVKLVDWEFARLGPKLWDQAGFLQSVLAYVAVGWLDLSASVVNFTREVLGDVLSATSVERLSLLTSIRLWQTAIEWETENRNHSGYSAALCQVALNVAEHPQRLLRLLHANA